MVNSINMLIITIVFLLFFFTFPWNAHAYLDPGTGSFVIQLAIAAIAGISFTAKIYWGKVRGFALDIFRRLKNKDKSE